MRQLYEEYGLDANTQAFTGEAMEYLEEIVTHFFILTSTTTSIYIIAVNCIIVVSVNT